LKPRDCPCHSGKRYKDCCEPFHTGAREAPTPEALMRSRYAAFALGLGDYLVGTLSSDHADRDFDASTLAGMREGQRFLDLCILHASEAGDEGEVLFYARIFKHGVDRSFVELSALRKESGAWRYAPESVAVQAKDLPPNPKELTLERFLEMLD
jgi:SEC-C motif-containing protein